MIVFVASTPGALPTPAKGACVTSPRRARVRAPKSVSGEVSKAGGETARRRERRSSHVMTREKGVKVTDGHDSASSSTCFERTARPENTAVAIRQRRSRQGKVEICNGCEKQNTIRFTD